jgi:flagellar biosynthetic protein FliQ
MSVMEEAEIVGLAREAIWMTLKLGMPIMMVGLFVGLIVALFQALTQIQEMTLAFVPKIVVIFAAIYVLLPSFAIMMTEYMKSLSDIIIAGNLGG